MQFKSLQVESMDEAGKGQARIAVLSAVDSDGDTYAPGAFGWKDGGGQWVQMIPAHNRQAMPFGKAWLREEGDQALADFQLNLDTQAGKDWHSALKFDLATGKPVQEWSYGFKTLDSAKEQRGNQRVNVLKRLDVHEISPVLRGAGVGTGTIAIKSAELKAEGFAPLIASLAELAETVREKGTEALSAAGLKQLAEIHAAIGAALDPGEEAAAVAASQQVIERVHASMLELMSRRHLPR